MMLGSGVQSGPHWWEVSALTTAPSLLPRMGSRTVTSMRHICLSHFFVVLFLEGDVIKKYLRKEFNHGQSCIIFWLWP